MKVDLELLHELIRTLEASGLSEIKVSDGKEKIRLRRDAPGQPVVVSAATPLAAVGAASQSTVETSGGNGGPELDGDGAYVTSPFVGTFYRASSPTAEPFVRTGDTIKPGQTLCIVEAMKLMNEIESELEGTIVEVLAENGKPVEYGDPLFKIKPA